MDVERVDRVELTSFDKIVKEIWVRFQTTMGHSFNKAFQFHAL